MRDLTLTVRHGEIFGFLGPNGAGKSTSIKMLLGLARPTSGEALVMGAPPGDVEVRRKIGLLPENFRFYEWLTPPELLHLHGRLCGVPSDTLASRVPALIDAIKKYCRWIIGRKRRRKYCFFNFVYRAEFLYVADGDPVPHGN